MARLLPLSLLLLCSACSVVVNNKLDEKPLDLCSSDDDCNEGTGGCGLVCHPEDDAADEYGCVDGEAENGSLCGENPLQRCRMGECSMLVSCMNEDDCECREQCADLGEGLRGCIPLPGGEVRPDGQLCNNVIGGLGLCYMRECRVFCDDNSSCRCTEDCGGPDGGGDRICIPQDMPRRVGSCLSDSGEVGLCLSGECRR